MATYGEGDPTDNAQDFYDWLQENDDQDLSGLNYTVSHSCQYVSSLLRIVQIVYDIYTNLKRHLVHYVNRHVQCFVLCFFTFECVL